MLNGNTTNKIIWKRLRFLFPLWRRGKNSVKRGWQQRNREREIERAMDRDWLNFIMLTWLLFSHSWFFHMPRYIIRINCHSFVSTRLMTRESHERHWMPFFIHFDANHTRLNRISEIKYLHQFFVRKILLIWRKRNNY